MAYRKGNGTSPLATPASYSQALTGALVVQPVLALLALALVQLLTRKSGPDGAASPDNADAASAK